MQQLDSALLHLVVRLRRISKYYEACYGKRAPLLFWLCSFRLRPAMQQLDSASLHLAVRLRRISKYYEACYGKRAPRNISLHGLVFTKSLYSISIHDFETVLK